MSQTFTVKLGEVTEIARGSSPRPIRNQAYFDGGTIPWVKIADATASTKFIYKTKQYVNDYGASFSRKLPPGTLIVAASGTLGFAIFLGVEACIHDGWLYFKRIDESKLDKGYLYFVLNALTSSFNAIAYGAAIQNINTKILRETQIPLPELKTQRKIAAIISAYDDLIETNKRRIALLEKMAEEIYREWFVRMRFPGYRNTRFIKGVPEGWAQSTLGEISRFTMGQSPKSEFYNQEGEGLPFHQGVGTYGSRFPKTVTYCSVEGRKAYQGDILFSVRAPVGRLNIAGCDLIIGRGLAAIKHREGQNSYLYYLLKTAFASEDIIGNGAIFNSVSKNELERFPIHEHPASLIDAFENIARPIDEKINALTRLNSMLTASRDLLLPRLISGKLSVEDLDIQFPPSMEDAA